MVIFWEKQWHHKFILTFTHLYLPHLVNVVCERSRKQTKWNGWAILHVAKKAIMVFQFLACFCNPLFQIDIKVHLEQKCFVWVTFLWSKIPILLRAEMREGGKPLPLAFQHLIFMIWRPCYLNLVTISSVASKCQHFKLRGLQFHYIKWRKKGHSNFKVLAFWSQLRYHDQIQIIRSSYQKNQILKS